MFNTSKVERIKPKPSKNDLRKMTGELILKENVKTHDVELWFLESVKVQRGY